MNDNGSTANVTLRRCWRCSKPEHGSTPCEFAPDVVVDEYGCQTWTYPSVPQIYNVPGYVRQIWLYRQKLSA